MTRIRHNLRNEDQDGWTFSGSGQRMRLTAVKALGAIAPETPCSDCNVMWKFSRQLVGLWLMNNSINQVWWSIWWCETVIYDSWCTQPKWYKYCSKAVADTFWCWCSHPNNALNKQCLHVDPGFFSKGILVLIHAQTATGMILNTYANVSKSWGCSNIY